MAPTALIHRRNRRLFLTCLLATCGLAAGAIGQVQLDLRIVPQSGTLPGPVADQPDTQHDDLVVPGQIRRFEVQYRILDVNTGDAIVPAGLSNMEFDICATGASIGATVLQRARLSAYEVLQAAASAPPPIDTSGFPAGPLGTATGLHRPFRGGIPSPAPNNGNPANGVIAGPCILAVTPLAVIAAGQGCTPCGQNNSDWYGLYSFELLVGAGACGRIDLTATPRFGGGSYYSYFDNTNPVPVSGVAFTTTPAYVNTAGTFPGCTYPLCPQAGTNATALVSTFSLAGAVTGQPWYWRIDNDPTGTPFQSMPADQLDPGVCSTCTLYDIALAMASDINSYFHNPAPSCSASQIFAVAIPTGGGNADLSITTHGGSKARLLVGPYLSGTGSATCDVSPGPCSFQPQITRIPLPGHDCNGNAIDDAIDIATGSSLDANNDGVPDECGSACPLAITALPAYQSASPHGTAAFTIAAAGGPGISYQWRRNGTNLVNGPTGAGSTVSGAVGTGASSTLTISNIALTDGALYDCVVTNSCARITGPTIGLRVNCPADYNQSQQISPQDIYDFLHDLFSNLPRADVNHSGTVSVEDLFIFLAAYFTGCP